LRRHKINKEDALSLPGKKKKKRFEASWPCYLDGIGVVRIRNGVEQI
jgi:hypothetical protein